MKQKKRKTFIERLNGEDLLFYPNGQFMGYLTSVKGILRGWNETKKGLAYKDREKHYQKQYKLV